MLKQTEMTIRWVHAAVRYPRILLLLVLLPTAYFTSALASVEQSQPISLGIHTPVTPFMWKGGVPIGGAELDSVKRQRWMYLEKNLDNVTAWGGQWNIVPVYQWLDDATNFARLHRVVSEHEKRGIKVVFRIIEEPEVYTRFSEVETEEYGYDEKYYRWMRSLAREFGPKVKCFLVGNESELDLGHTYHWKSDAPKHLQLTYDQYRKVLSTAVRAVKSVDPGIEVANSGFSDKSIALAVAQSINEKHGITEAQRFWEDWKGVGGVRAEGRLGLYRLLEDDDVQRRIEFVRRSVSEPMGSDLFQIHYYGGWRGMQPMLDWINAEMRASGSVRPLIAAEVGYRINSTKRKGADGKTRFESDWDHYSEDEHATNTVRNFTILAGNGVTRSLYWAMREAGASGLAVRLFPPTDDVDAFPATRASQSFRVLATALNGVRVQAPGAPLPAGVWAYRFKGEYEFSIVWTDGGVVTPAIKAARQIRDIEGQTHVIESLSSTLLSEPLYLFVDLVRTPASTAPKPQ